VTVDFTTEIDTAINSKTKPRGSLGVLEDLAAQLCRIQASLTPSLVCPTIVVFAADHGVARHKVSAYPREVTAQMAQNMLSGGAAISVLSDQHGIDVVLVDSGVDWPSTRPAGMIDHWMGPGTADPLLTDAMTAEQVQDCLGAGADVIAHAVDPRCTIVGFGELGIGNTSSAALIMSGLTGLDIQDCAGPGSGLSPEGLADKIQILGEILAAHPTPHDGFEALQMYGGFEIAQMTGAMLAGYRSGRILMIDGFVASAAFLAAWSIEPAIRDCAVFCHQSDEPGHRRLLDHLHAEPLLNLGMRLGEGTGCAVAYPIIVSAATFLNNMANFDTAGVSTGDPETVLA
jgi:nicotinate-nucleotide--dimethylbenzimidazole phosphoribosyltransferase